MSEKSRREAADDRRFAETDLNAPSHDEPYLNCRGLAALVIEQARRDLRGQWRGRSMYPSEQAEREQAVREAYDFLTGAPPAWRAMLEDWCEILDLDVEAVIADARAGCVEQMGQRQRTRRRRDNTSKTHEKGVRSHDPLPERLMTCPASPVGS